LQLLINTSLSAVTEGHRASRRPTRGSYKYKYIVIIGKFFLGNQKLLGIRWVKKNCEKIGDYGEESCFSTEVEGETSAEDHKKTLNLSKFDEGKEIEIRNRKITKTRESKYIFGPIYNV